MVPPRDLKNEEDPKNEADLKNGVYRKYDDDDKIALEVQKYLMIFGMVAFLWLVSFLEMIAI